MRQGRDDASHLQTVGWIALTAATGFAASFVFSSILHWARGAFVFAYSLLVAALALWFLYRRAIDPGPQLTKRWRAGTVLGLVAGAMLAKNVLAQPVSERLTGLALVGGLLWFGALYGVVDAVLLSVLPVLMIYGSRPAAELASPGGRLKWGLLALVGSAVVTAAYHLGFSEYRGSAVVQPIVGNTVMTLAYLLSGNPLGAILSHMLMHGAGVIHGMEGTTQLPPHY